MNNDHITLTTAGLVQLLVASTCLGSLLLMEDVGANALAPWLALCGAALSASGLMCSGLALHRLVALWLVAQKDRRPPRASAVDNLYEWPPQP